MAHFDLNNTPLEKGTTLIEASAGTGKTYTIAAIFLRLLIEERLNVREILVVTYTEAATEELRGRIRNALVAAQCAFAGGTCAAPHVAELVRRHAARSVGIARDLELALADFDEAPIFTIHGFSQRMLRDRAFESGELFDVELLTDQSPLLREIAEDFWRKQLYTASPMLVNFALKNHLGPDRLLPLVKTAISHPGLELLPPEDVGNRSLNELAMNLAHAFTSARDIWLRDGEEIRRNFGDAIEWAKVPYSKSERMAVHFAGLDNSFSAEPVPASFGALAMFTNEALVGHTLQRRAGETPTHAFFGQCDEVVKAEGAWLVGLKIRFFQSVRDELRRRKAEAKAQSFDDLLSRLHEALLGEGGDALAAAIRSKFKAALIDEFQDTDPVQYGSFERIFRGGANWLFLIGDPKQAIYGFRGADIFTYRTAARSVAEPCTLGTNWRSEKPLVAAVNAVFSRSPKPFVFDWIPFEPAVASVLADNHPLIKGGLREPPLRIWFWPRDDQSKQANVGVARPALACSVATEIVRLLNGDAQIGGRKLLPGQIAVLVLTHRQADMVQRALAARNVPSVQHGTGNVFESHEAAELERVLAAIAQPARTGLLRGALATDILGMDAAHLDALGADGDAWQARLTRFLEYRADWLDRGFIAMFVRLLHDEDARTRLLSFPDGERRLTNVLHLAELLHQAAVERRLGPGALLKWLGEQRQDEDAAPDAHQLRLERDEDAVKLVTVHTSKGLEYDVVFCPFSWRHSELKQHTSQQEQVLFHDGSEPPRLMRDLGSRDIEAHRPLALAERLAENVRLLYVALTRARHRCYLAWGCFRQAETSAPAWLLHPPAEVGMDPVGAMQARFKEVTDTELLADLQVVAASAEAAAGVPVIGVEAVPEADDEEFPPPAGTAAALDCRAFTGRIRGDWRIASFSLFTANAPEELPDHDSITVPAQEEEADAAGIFAFPRGTQAGSCLHKIFEELDVTQHGDAALDGLVYEQLAAHGFDAALFTPCVCAAVRRTLAVPLGERGDGFTLSQVTRDRRLTELEFGFPLRTLSSSALADCFERHGDAGVLGRFPERVRSLPFAAVRGHLKGYVDLVFESCGRYFIADWKSNHLGNHAEDYSADKLRGVMAGHHYFLQYHLYAVALHRYLALRLAGYDYERHFGGVAYLFVRGVDPARPEVGVFRDRPSLGLIEALDGLLVEAEESA